MAIVDPARAVTGGVDTHLDLNVAAAIDHIGGLLGVAEFPTTSSGHKELLAWLKAFGPLAQVGIEGTSSYGAGLSRYLRRAGTEVVEVDRPNRQSRRRSGKSDPADAVEAARAALSGRAQGAGKSKDGNVEAIRALVVAKRSARDTKIKTMNQIRHLGFTAPDELRERLAGVSRKDLAATAAALRPREGGDQVAFATKTALCLLGRRVLALDARSTVHTTRCAMILYGNNRQEKGPGSVDHQATAGSAPAPGPLAPRRRGADLGGSSGARSALWEGGVPVQRRRAARSLYICRPAQDRWPYPDGLRAGGSCRSRESRGGRLGPGAGSPGGDLGHKHRALVPRSAELSATGHRGRSGCGQHGHRCLGGRR
jgi:hypothetical protein